MYNPASDETSPGSASGSRSSTQVHGTTDLSGWLFDDEDATNWGAIPSGTIIESRIKSPCFSIPHFTDATTFRTEWSVPGKRAWWSEFPGAASATARPGNEVLQLLDNLSVRQDVVNYDDTSPWPSRSRGSEHLSEELCPPTTTPAQTGLARFPVQPRQYRPLVPRSPHPTLVRPAGSSCPATTTRTPRSTPATTSSGAKRLAQQPICKPTAAAPRSVFPTASSISPTTLSGDRTSAASALQAAPAAALAAGEMLVATSFSEPPAAASSESETPAAGSMTSQSMRP